VCRAAADHGVMMEVNALPDRLDLAEDDIRVALEHGLKLVVSTDAHGTRDLQLMKWGIDHARRAWVTAEDVANTRSLPDFLKMLGRPGT
jgi:DNA polymerase (family 10)